MSADNLTADDIIAMCKPKSDQLNAEDLLHGPITAKVRGVKGNASPDGKQPLSVFLADRPHPWKPCVTMIRILSLAWGTDVAAWIGRSIRLYRDPEVRMGAQKVGGIRIAAMSNLPQTPFKATLTVTRGKREEFAIAPLAAEAAPTKPPARAPVEVPTWAAEGDAGLTDEQVGEVVALLASRSLTVAKVEQSMGTMDAWTAETVRAIVQRLNR